MSDKPLSVDEIMDLVARHANHHELAIYSQAADAHMHHILKAAELETRIRAELEKLAKVTGDLS
jgi:hypothetical protein